MVAKRKGCWGDGCPLGMQVCRGAQNEQAKTCECRSTRQVVHLSPRNREGCLKNLVHACKGESNPTGSPNPKTICQRRRMIPHESQPVSLHGLRAIAHTSSSAAMKGSDESDLGRKNELRRFHNEGGRRETCETVSKYVWVRCLVNAKTMRNV